RGLVGAHWMPDVATVLVRSFSLDARAENCSSRPAGESSTVPSGGRLWHHASTGACAPFAVAGRAPDRGRPAPAGRTAACRCRAPLFAGAGCIHQDSSPARLALGLPAPALHTIGRRSLVRNDRRAQTERRQDRGARPVRDLLADPSGGVAKTIQTGPCCTHRTGHS